MEVKLALVGLKTTLVCRAAYPGERARVTLVGSRENGRELRILCELQCQKLDEQITLRVESGVSFTVVDVSPIESDDGHQRLMEVVDPSWLHPRINQIADQSRSPTILL
jgi:hypothetical protein